VDRILIYTLISLYTNQEMKNTVELYLKFAYHGPVVLSRAPISKHSTPIPTTIAEGPHFVNDGRVKLFRNSPISVRTGADLGLNDSRIVRASCCNRKISEWWPSCEGKRARTAKTLKILSSVLFEYWSVIRDSAISNRSVRGSSSQRNTDTSLHTADRRSASDDLRKKQDGNRARLGSLPLFCSSIVVLLQLAMSTRPARVFVIDKRTRYESVARLNETDLLATFERVSIRTGVPLSVKFLNKLLDIRR
jgi:hypothetical protein